MDNFTIRLRKQSKHVWSIIVLLCLILISWPIWMNGEPATDDISNLNAPQRILLSWFYHHSHMPFWNPFSFGGQPFLSAGQSGPLYLPNIIFICVPIVLALKVSLLFHVLLAAISSYGVTMTLTRSRFGSLVSATAFSTCGFLIGHQIHTQMFDAMCWLPACFWCLLMILRKPTKWNVSALIFCIGLQLYAGHPQICFMTLLFLGLYVLLHLLQNWSREAFKSTFLALLGVLIGYGISAPQWLPTLRFAAYTVRAQSTPSFLLEGSMPDEGLLQFLTPFLGGGGYSLRPFSEAAYEKAYAVFPFWEFSCYVGIIALTLAIAAAILRFKTTESVRNLTLIGILFLGLSFGNQSVLRGVLTHAPGFDLFRIPARYIGLVDFCIAVLAGIGICALQEKATKKNHVMPITAMCIAGALLMGCLLVGVRYVSPLVWGVPTVLLLAVVLLTWNVRRSRLVPVVISSLSIVDVVSQSYSLSTYTLTNRASYAHPSPVIQFLNQHLHTLPSGRIVSVDSPPLQLDRPAAYQIESINGYDALQSSWYDTTVGMTWNETSIFVQPRSLLDAYNVRYLVTGIRNPWFIPTKTEGVTQWSTQIPVLHGTPASIELDVEKATGQGTIDADVGPMLSVTVGPSPENSKTHLIDATGANSYVMKLGQYSSQMQRNSTVKTNELLLTIRNERWSGATRLARIVGKSANGATLFVKNVNLSFAPAPWHKVFHSGNNDVWENPDTIRAAWLVPSAANIMSNGFYHTVPGDRIQVNQYSPNQQMLQVAASSASFLMVSQTYDPGWSATVDGQHVKVSQMNQVLTGIPVPKGHHVVVLSYVPVGFREGLTAFALSVALWIGMTVVWKRTATKKRNGRTRTDG